MNFLKKVALTVFFNVKFVQNLQFILNVRNIYSNN